MLKINKKLKSISVFCLGMFCSGLTVYANSYLAKDITFVPSNANWKVSSVEEAINYLHDNNNKLEGVEGFIGVSWNYDYKGAEDTFIAPVTGTYKLEVWGASGGKGISGGSLSSVVPGYGGYSVGEVVLQANEKIYINVGERGKNAVKKKNVEGSYNGGGGGSWDASDDESAGGGGGATHIAKVSGLLSTLENNISDILIVTGGGGGVACCRTAASGGGFQGVTLSTTTSTPATQVSGYLFGLGQTGVGVGGSSGGYNEGEGGGGGGFYGGLSNNVYKASSGAGGSGYIGNPLLKNKSMYCYNCVESNEENIKTISTTNVSSSPISEYAKIDNGYAKITLVGVD